MNPGKGSEVFQLQLRSHQQLCIYLISLSLPLLSLFFSYIRFPIFYYTFRMQGKWFGK